jgi:NAD(P)-dependent dehydrogenase (short-subunit alcohol dehydrogenase family)
LVIGRDEIKGKKFTEEISSTYNVASSFIQADLNSKESIDSFMNNLDKVDILVNNAFTWPSTLNIEDTDWHDFESTLTSGVTSSFYLAKKAIEKMKSHGKGSIINLASMYGIVSPNFKIYREQPKMGNALAYNAAKAAIIQMTKYLAVYCAKWNIRVNCISPGPFPRPGTFSNGKEWFEDELKNMNPMKKLGEPWHLKGGVLLLASDLGEYITGQNIVIDGGWTIW